MAKAKNDNWKKANGHAKKTGHGTYRAKRKPNSPRVKSQIKKDK